MTALGPDVTILDATGLNCPIPILRTKKALAALPGGARLLVKSTDPDSVRDFHRYVEMKHHTLVSHREIDGIYEFIIQK